MTTPEFEEWLTRQDISVEYTTDVDRYIEYLRDEFGISGDTEDIARGVFDEKYNILSQLGIHPFTYYETRQGERYATVRYGITEYPGAWGRDRMMDIALEKTRAQGWAFGEAWLLHKREEG